MAAEGAQKLLETCQSIVGESGKKSIKSKVRKSILFSIFLLLFALYSESDISAIPLYYIEKFTLCIEHKCYP